MKQATEDGTMVPTAWEITKDQEVVNIANGCMVSVRGGVNIKNCYVHGGQLTIKANANVSNCIVNRGALIIESYGNVGSLLIKEGATLNIHSEVKLKKFRSTGAINLSMYPRASIKS